MIESAKEILP